MKRNAVEIIAGIVILAILAVVAFVIVGNLNNKGNKTTKDNPTTRTTTKPNTKTTDTKSTTKDTTITHNVTYVLDGGTNNSENPTTFTNKDSITLKDASKDGYEFVGWYSDSSFNNKITILDSNIESDITLYAKFEEIVIVYDYSIIYHLDDGINNPNNPSGFMEDETFTLLPATKLGYDFIGWYTTDAYTNEVTEIEFNFDYELYAKFEIHEYTITYNNVDGLINTNPNTYTINYGTINLKPVNKEYCNFLGWYTTSTFDEDSKITSIDSQELKDYVLYSKFEIVPVDATINVTPKDLTYNTFNQELLSYTVDGGVAYFSLDNINFSEDIPAGKNAGDYIVYYKVIGDEYHNDLDINNIVITIKKKTIDNRNIDLPDGEFTYDGDAKSLAYIGDLPEEITGVNYYNNEQTEVGEYDVVMTFEYDTNNYSIYVLQIEATLKINKATIDMSEVVFDNLTITYDGSEHSIFATNTPSLITNVSYTNNGQVNVGTYTITVTFDYDKTNYTATKGSLTATLTINKATIDMSEVVFDDSTVTYDGNEHSITATNIPSLITNVTYTNNGKVNAGTYEITVTFDYDKDNYLATKDSLTATLTINPATITNANVVGYTGDFDDESHNAAVEYSATTVGDSTITWLFSNDNATWVSADGLKVKNPTDSKTYYFKASAANHEDLTGTFTVKIRTIATITIVNLNALSKTFDGNYIVDPIIETNSNATPYIIYTWGPNSSAQKPVNAGTYTINVQVSENEDFTSCTVTGTIIIEKANYTLPNNLFVDKTVTYTGEEFSITIDESLLPSTLKVTYSNNTLTNVGSTLATATFENKSSNYNDVDPITATLTVTKATITNPDVEGYNGVADDEYHNAAAVFTATTVDDSTITWLFSNDGENWVSANELQVKDPSDTGTYYYKASAANHNDITGTFNVVITEKNPSNITITNLSDLAKVYDGSSIIDPDIETNSNGKITITYSLDGETFTSAKPVNAGTYIIKVVTEETASYAQGIITKQFTISKATIDMSEVVFDDSTVTYDGNEHSITATNIPSLITNVTYTNNGKVNAGTYEITVTFDYDKDNYLATKDSLTATLTINPATITNANVVGYTGDFDDESHNAAVEYSATTVGDSTITWLFSNDNATWVSADGLKVKNPTDSKTYYFKASAANHEDLTGTFTVKIRTIATITIVNLNALSKTFDGNYIVDPIIETNSNATPYIIYTWGPNSSAQKPVNAGTYTINVQVSENEDFTSCTVTGTIIIEKANYTLPNNLFVDKTVTYTGEEFSITIDESLLPSTLKVTYSNNTLTNVGSTLATATFENKSSNYNDVDPITATLTVTKATPTTSGTTVNYDEGVGSFFTTNKTTSSIVFNGAYNTEGIISYSDARESLEIGTLSYSYTFTPTDTTNYETVSGTVEIITKATVEYYDGSTLLNTLYVAKNGTATNLSLTPKVGYTANGWTLSGSTSLYDFATLITDNLSLYTKYTLNTYTIAYVLDGGTNNPSNPSSYNVHSDTISLANASKENFEFLGWYRENTFTNKVTQIVSGSTGDITLYAKYEEILPDSLTITYHLNGGENNSSNPNYYTAETTPFELLDPTKGNAYTFAGWYLDSSFTNRIVTVDPSVMTESFDLYAKWSALQYSIMYYYGSKRITDLNPKSYTIEDTVTLPTYSVYNHTFNGWYTDSALTNPITTIPAGSTGTVKVYAKLTDNGFTVSFYDTDKTTLLGTQTTSTYGSVTAPSYSYDSSKYILKWVDKSTNELVNLSSIDSNYDLYVELVVISYTANIYYVDSDGFSTSETGSPIITSKTISSLTYGDDVSLYRQMRVTNTTSYDYFYMSPIEALDWSLVVGSLAIGAQKIASDNSCTCYATVEGNTGTIRIYVFCIQAVAIITSSTQSLAFAQNLDMSTSNYQFYSTVDSAFEAFASQSNKLMRIYGRANKTTKSGQNTIYPLNGNCFGNTSNVTIAQASATVEGITVTRPQLIYYCSDYILHNSYNLTSGSIILPYSRKCEDTSGYRLQTTAANSTACIHSLLVIDSGVTLNLSIDINIGGDIVSGSSLYGRGVLMNNGTINVESGASVKSYGFLKGTGNLIINSGATLTDYFYIYDWPGGANGMGFYNKNIFPFENYSFHNVSCNTRIYSGSTYKAWCQLYMASTFVAKDMVLVGNGGLFQLSSGYIDKSIMETSSNVGTNTNYASSNTNQTVKDIIDIHGNFTDNTISIQIKIIGTQTVSTSTSMALPIGFMTIKVSEGNGTLSKNSYKFLPGSSLIIEKLGSVTISSGVKVIFYDEYPDDYTYTDNNSNVHSGADNPYSYQKIHSAIYTEGAVKDGYHAQLIVNGSLSVKGNLGGKISTTRSTGKVSLSNTSGTLPKPTSLTYGSTGSSCNSTNETIPTKIYLLVDDSFVWTNASAVTYSSIEHNGEFGFTQYSNAHSFDVTYHYSSTSVVVTINTENSTHIIEDTDLFDIDIEGYTFGGWYVNQTYTTPALGYEISGDIDLYAKLTAIIYNIEYVEFIIDDYDDTMQIINNNQTYFTITDTVTLSPASCGDLTFYGWFVDDTFSIEAPDINSSTLQYYKYLMENNTIYLYGYFTSIERYSIVYRNEDGTIIEALPGYQIIAGETITLADALASYQSTEGVNTTNYAYDLYVFSKWVVVSSNGQIITQLDANSTYTPSTNITLVPSFVKEGTYVKITPGTITNASYIAKVSGNDVGSSGAPFYVKVGTSVVYTMTYNATSNPENNFTYQPVSGNKTSGSNTSYTVTANYNATVSVSSENGGSGTCLLPTSEVMLADGTIKLAKDITTEDIVISFNNFTGQFEATKISFYAIVDYRWFDIIELTFDNGKVLKVATGHGLFNMTYNKYEIYYAGEFENHIGETFATVDYIDGEFVISGATLVSVRNTKEYVQKYSPISEYNINIVADGVLTIPDDIEGMYDIFTFNDDLTIDIISFISEIEMYGTFSYDEVKDIVPEYLFDVVNFKYFKTFILKGVLTIEQVNHWLDAYLPIIVEEHNLEFDYENRQFLTSDMFN